MSGHHNQNGSTSKSHPQDTLINQLPKHVAIIMDGNGRWAKKRFLPRVEGHRNGAKSVRKIVEEARRLGISYLTLFAFSTENWLRPGEEVSSLMKLFIQYLKSECSKLAENNIKLRAIGDLDRLSSEVRDSLNECIEKTKNGSEMELHLAISYGGREEIVNATKRIAQAALLGDIDLTSIDNNLFRSYLYAPDVPDPDLLIRTSDENRISNFLLWQLAYAEMVITPVLWPDFDETEFKRCLSEYSGRNRRFGLTDDQLGPSV